MLTFHVMPGRGDGYPPFTLRFVHDQCRRIGPTACCLVQYVVGSAEVLDKPTVELEPEALAEAMGVSVKILVRTLGRLEKFNIIIQPAPGVFVMPSRFTNDRHQALYYRKERNHEADLP